MNTQTEAHASRGLSASNSRLQASINWFVDLIFPPTCHGCGRVDTHWCDVCLAELNTVPITITDLSQNNLAGLCATGHHTGKLQEAIQSLKYYNTPHLAIPLGNRLTTALQTKQWIIDTIVPVPLFAAREQKRGYNQAYLLSQQVESMSNITCQPNLLQRHRDTNQQVGLSASERRENVKDAFDVTIDVTDLSVLIIDDVVTTGSTLDSCATALLSAGAKTVYALTVTHA